MVSLHKWFQLQDQENVYMIISLPKTCIVITNISIIQEKILHWSLTSGSLCRYLVTKNLKAHNSKNKNSPLPLSPGWIQTSWSIFLLLHWRPEAGFYVLWQTPKIALYTHIVTESNPGEKVEYIFIICNHHKYCRWMVATINALPGHGLGY